MPAALCGLPEGPPEISDWATDVFFNDFKTAKTASYPAQ